MIDVKQVDRLLRYQDPDGAVLSLYLNVPANAGGLREMFVRLENLLCDVAAKQDRASHSVKSDLAAAREEVRGAVTEHVRDWLGHGVAIMSAPSLGLYETVPVSWPVPDRAVVEHRPYVRPLMSALHHARPYYVVVVERRQAWIFRADGESIEPVSKLVGEGVRDRSHAGWAGLEEYNTRHRAAELARRHYRSTAATVENLMRGNGRDLVVGGHEVSIVEFVGMLPDGVRRKLVGTFVVDPHTMTAGDVRTRGARARDQRRVEHERRVLAEIADQEATGLAVSGIEACADAVNLGQAAVLVVHGEDVVPGFDCLTCGELSVDPAERCGGCGSGPLRPVFDLVDELVARVVQQGGGVEFVDADELGGGLRVSATLRGRLARQAR